jgi:hypothetical protein
MGFGEAHSRESLPHAAWESKRAPRRSTLRNPAFNIPFFMRASMKRSFDISLGNRNRKTMVIVLGRNVH